MVNLSVLIGFVCLVFGLSKGQGMSKDLYRCRQICYTRFVQDWHHCMDYQECKNMCITPPNINNYIPEAFSFLCWNSCDETLGPFPLSVTSASRQGSLVLADIAWDQAITNTSKQCLVTWEVSGGGLMGNLLTDSSTVELSLWADTVYHVQVTCKNKETGTMRRSFKLIVDTRKLSGVSSSSPSSSSSSSSSSVSSTSSTVPTISVDASVKRLEDLFPTESLSKETEDRLRILKDSSKDKINTNNNNKVPSQTITSSSSTTTTGRTSSSPSSSSETTFSHHMPSVIRSKLSSSHGDLSDIYSWNIIYAMIGSLGLFLGILFIYILTRSSIRDDPPVDKEELIRNEMFPSGTRTLHV